MTSETPLILTINNDEQTINITQNKQSHTMSYKDLRYKCQCALCVDENTGKQILKKSDIDPNITINRTYPIGHYGQGIEWNEHGKTHQSMFQNNQLINNFK